MKKAGITSVLSMLLVAATACSDKGDPISPAPTAKNPNRIEVALVASLSGPDASVGAEAQRGALTAIGQINALGGIMGKQLALRIVDDQSNPNITEAKIRELAEKDGIVFGIGPSTSRTAKQILPIIKTDRVLYISPSATSQELNCLEVGSTPEETARLCEEQESAFDPNAPVKPLLFKTAASDAFQATAIAQFASEAVNGTRRCASIAILRQADSYGIPISEALRERYRALNLGVRDPLLDLSPTVDTDDTLRSAANTIGNSRVQCQVVIAQPAVAGSYMRAFKAWKDLNSATLPAGFVTIGSDGFRQDEFIVQGRVRQNDPASPTAGEESFAVAADTSPVNSVEFNTFLSLFEAAYPNVAPGRYSSTAYDAVVTLAAAMERAKSNTDVPAVRKALVEISSGRTRASSAKMDEFFQAVRSGEDLNYEGASGQIDYQKDTGGVRNDFGVWQIVDAKFVQTKRFELSELSD